MHSKFNLSLLIIILLSICISSAFGQTPLEHAITEATSEIASTLKEVNKIDRIAIVTLREDQDNEVTDRLITAIVNSGKYQVIDRQKLEILFKEQDFQMRDVVDQKTAKRAGKIAGVDAVIYGEVKRRVAEADKGEIAMHVRMVDVQTGEIVDAKDVEHTYRPEPSNIWKYLIGGLIVLVVVVLLVVFFKPKPSVTPIKTGKTPKTVQPEGQYQTVDELDELLSVEQPQSVKCRINLKTRKAEIDRIVLKLSGSKAIPAGWRGKIAIVEGINRRYSLADSIPLPVIVPGRTPINPGTVKIPRDIAESSDSWSLEFYIVDPQGGELLLFRSPSVSFV